MVVSPITLERLELLEQIARDIAWRRLPPDEAQDFVQCVHLRLLERNYEVFERFSGRSSLRTYLTVVITRLLLDWRNSQYGKWRPAAAATRNGEHAILLDRLMNRDGLSPEEAVQVVAGRRGSPPMEGLRDMASRLPRRPRRRPVPTDVLNEIPGSPFADPLDVAERRRVDRQIRVALARAIRQLSPEERMLVQARYYQRVPMRVVGPVLNRPPKLLYRQLERALGRLREVLIAQGVTGPERLSATSLGRCSSDN